MALAALIQLPLNDLASPRVSFNNDELMFVILGWDLTRPLLSHLLDLYLASNLSPMTIAVAIMTHFPRDLIQFLCKSHCQPGLWLPVIFDAIVNH